MSILTTCLLCSSLSSSALRDPQFQSSLGAGSSDVPADADAHMLSNLLDSHAAELDASSLGGSQMRAGPVTAIMASMGIRMPAHNEDDERKQ